MKIENVNMEIVRCSLAIIDTSNGILFLKRTKEDDLYPSMYCLPGGKCNEGENHTQCLRREVKEETGLTIDHHIHVGLRTFRRNGKFYKMYFYLVIIGNTTKIDSHMMMNKVLLSDEHVDYKCIYKKYLKETRNIAPVTKKFLLTYFKIK